MTVLRWTFWENGEEYGKSETWVLSRTDRINLNEEQFAQIQSILREKKGYLKTIFSDSLLRLFSKLSHLQYQIRPVPVEWLMEIYSRYDLADQLVEDNLNLLWESFCNYLYCNFSLRSAYLNGKQRSEKGGLNMDQLRINSDFMMGLICWYKRAKIINQTVLHAALCIFHLCIVCNGHNTILKWQTCVVMISMINK